MKTFKSISFLFVVSFFTYSCSKSGTKALEKGDYYNATLQAVDKLKKDVDNEKSLEVLPISYNEAKSELLFDINNARKANQQFKYERVLENYSKLNKMHDLIAKCVPCRRAVSPQSYFKEAEEAREMAAEERYIFGSEMLKKGTIEGGRDAYDSFEKLFQFAPNFKDVRVKMDEALDAGSVHVVLEQPRLNSKMFQYSYDYFSDQIAEFLRDNKRMNKFIRFYSPEEAGSVNLKADHVVRLEFVDFVVGQTLLEKNKQPVTSKDSVKTGTATVKGEKVDVYGKVSADLIRNKKTVSSRGILSMEILDYKQNRVLEKKEFPGEFIWINEWATYNGDERALTDEDKNMCKKNEELPPAPQALFVEFCKPIYSQLTDEIRRFYNKY